MIDLLLNSMDTWLQELRESNKLIIVEGKKDKERLESFGIKNIITISSSLTKTLENFSAKEVIILTDLDKHGRKLYSIIKSNLQKTGVKIDRKFREFLFKETKISQIEGIKIL